jgi:hypothetical protein
LLFWSQRSVKLTQLPSELGIPPSKKNFVKKSREFYTVAQVMHSPVSWLLKRLRSVKLTHAPGELGIPPVNKKKKGT